MELPELSYGDGSVDVNVRIGKVERNKKEESRTFGYSYASRQRYYIVHRLIGCIEVRNGDEIIIDPDREASNEAIRALILNLCMGVILHQRNILTFHASAVDINGKGVAFLGDKGSGKSTIASVLCRRGGRLITDDVLGVHIDSENYPSVLHGVSHVKLWPDAIKGFLDESPNRFKPIHHLSSKRLYPYEEVINDEKVSLSMICVLNRGKIISLSKISILRKITELITHTYTSRILNDTDAIKWHFDRISNIIRKVDIRLLSRPFDKKQLDNTASIIEDFIG